ncbi:MAG TPA: hypothetical protein PL001_00040 [Candidatus Kryptobacter bacterium]|nr:hypothetical protein [Candidatus Kryptobacter bacterium]
MIPRILLILTGTGIAGDSIISLLHGDVISGGTALAMVIIFFTLLRKIEHTNSQIDVLAEGLKKDIEDIKLRLGQITKTVVRVD